MPCDLSGHTASAEHCRSRHPVAPEPSRGEKGDLVQTRRFDPPSNSAMSERLVSTISARTRSTATRATPSSRWRRDLSSQIDSGTLRIASVEHVVDVGIGQVPIAVAGEDRARGPRNDAAPTADRRRRDGAFGARVDTSSSRNGCEASGVDPSAALTAMLVARERVELEHRAVDHSAAGA
jgi:hypothetical protein